MVPGRQSEVCQMANAPKPQPKEAGAKPGGKKK